VEGNIRGKWWRNGQDSVDIRARLTHTPSVRRVCCVRRGGSFCCTLPEDMSSDPFGGERLRAASTGWVQEDASAPKVSEANCFEFGDS
jgi:hypothetical protein